MLLVSTSSISTGSSHEMKFSRNIARHAARNTSSLLLNCENLEILEPSHVKECNSRHVRESPPSSNSRMSSNLFESARQEPKATPVTELKPATEPLLASPTPMVTPKPNAEDSVLALLDTGRYLVKVTLGYEQSRSLPVVEESRPPLERGEQEETYQNNRHDLSPLLVVTTIDLEYGPHVRNRFELNLHILPVKLQTCQMYTNGDELAIDDHDTCRVISLKTGQVYTTTSGSPPRPLHSFQRRR